MLAEGAVATHFALPEAVRETTPIRRPFRADLAMADYAGMVLVVIAGNAHNDELPVCKIVDLGRMKYQTQKKQAEARKKQKIVEIKVRPGIDIHDCEVKMRSVRRFFEEGDKVKVTVRFRGREMAHQELGMKVLDKVKEDTLLIAKVESEPRLEGRQMTMVLAPK
jgi:translation initiation factor IF-3